MSPIKSLLKAVEVLESFTPEKLELGVAEINRITGIPRATAHRILATLAEGRLLERSEKDGKYKIGPTLYALGRLYIATANTITAVQPVMETLNDLTDDAINASILDRGYATLITRVEAKYPFRRAAHVGVSVPAYCTSQGRALLSGLTEAEIDKLYPEEKLRLLTPKTIATKKQLKLQLEKIRKSGVSYNKEGAYIGIEGVSSVIRDTKGQIAAAMGIEIPIFRINRVRRQQLSMLIRLGCRLASYRLGYHDLSNPVRDVEEIRVWWEKEQKKTKS